MNEIEQIYNKLIADEKLKNGSKYERLAAVVYKTLSNNDTVVHDLRLRGDGKSAQHQIDVTIEKKGRTKRVLVECKQYDKVIGIGIIRDFYGAVAQIKPDEAFVVTTVGYTKGAINFAKDENIKLAILREAKNSDWEGLIRSIALNMTMNFMNTPSISWIAYNEIERDRVKKLLESNWGEMQSVKTMREFFYDENLNPICSYQELMKPILNAAPRIPGKITKGRHEFDDKMYVNLQGHFVAIKGFEYEFSSYSIDNQTVIDDGGKIASLLFKILDKDEKFLIFEEDIEKWCFDENGEVVSKKW